MLKERKAVLCNNLSNRFSFNIGISINCGSFCLLLMSDLHTFLLNARFLAFSIPAMTLDLKSVMAGFAFSDQWVQTHDLLLRRQTL